MWGHVSHRLKPALTPPNQAQKQDWAGKREYAKFVLREYIFLPEQNSKIIERTCTQKKTATKLLKFKMSGIQ